MPPKKRPRLQRASTQRERRLHNIAKRSLGGQVASSAQLCAVQISPSAITRAKKAITQSRPVGKNGRPSFLSPEIEQQLTVVVASQPPNRRLTRKQLLSKVRLLSSLLFTHTLNYFQQARDLQATAIKENPTLPRRDLGMSWVRSFERRNSIAARKPQSIVPVRLTLLHRII